VHQYLGYINSTTEKADSICLQISVGRAFSTSGVTKLSRIACDKAMRQALYF
ncbi:NADP-dependent malic enzyme, partial [Giardia duodenalis]